MATTPTLTVEIAFTYTPMTSGTVTWTDVSAYVRSGSIKRGRTNETEQFNAGTCEVVLDNRDRRFDPTNTSSPYAGYILPRNQIRVRATWSGTTYDLFRGFVTAWPQERALSNKDATVTVSASDGMAYLAAQRLGPDFYSSYLQTLSPTAAWALGDEGTTQTDNVGQQNFELTSDLGHSDAPCGDYLTGNGTTFDTINYGIGPTVTTNGAFSIVAFIRTNLGGPRGIIEGVAGNRLIVDGFGLPHYYGAVASAVYGNQSVIDGVNHMVVLTHDAASAVTGPTMYVDGLDKTAGSVAGIAGAAGVQYWQILANGTVGSGSAPFVGPIQQLAIIPKVLTPAEVYTLYFAAQNAWASYPSYQQVDAVLSIAGWPDNAGAKYSNAFRELSPRSVCNPDFVQTSNGTALEVIQKIVASEQGQFFIDRSGKATMLGGWDLYYNTRSATSQFTIADDNTAGTVAYSDTGFDLDDSFLANEVEVKTASGQSAFARNAVSISIYGKRTESIDSRVRTVGEAQQIANNRIARYGMPSPRLRTVSLQPMNNPTVEYPKVLDIELQDRITVRAQPLKVGSVHTQDYWIEGVEHVWAPKSWTTKVNASQVPNGGYWDLGTDGFDGYSTRLS